MANRMKDRLAFFDTLAIFADGAAGRKIPDTILLVKFGKSKFTKDGKEGEFEFSESNADSVITDFIVRGKDVVIDYEHQTLSGEKAPAAGWIDKLLKTSEGLVAKVKYWTREAENYLTNGEYRYFSPVLNFSRTEKSVSALHSVAITNHPALHNIPALVADDTSAESRPRSGDNNSNNETNETRETNMKKLMEKLGLTALSDSDDEARMNCIVLEVDKLLDGKKEVSGFLKLHDCDSLDKVTGKIQGMCPVTEKQALETALRKRDAETAVEKAFSDGKLMEKSKPWALSFAEKDLKGFSDWAEGAPVITPTNDGLGILNLGKPNGGEERQSFSDAEIKIFRQIGLTDEQIKTIKGTSSQEDK